MGFSLRFYGRWSVDQRLIDKFFTLRLGAKLTVWALRQKTESHDRIFCRKRQSHVTVVSSKSGLEKLKLGVKLFHVNLRNMSLN